MITKMSASSMNSKSWYRSMLAGNTAFNPMATNMELIETITSSSTSVTFSTIPTTYKHLQIRVGGKFSNGSVNTFIMRFNGDAGTNYAMHNLYAKGNLATLQAENNTTQSRIEVANMYGGVSETSPVIIDILDAFSATKNKTARCFSGTINTGATSETYTELRSGLWVNTSAISSITLTTAGGTSFASSRFSLYGIGG